MQIIRVSDAQTEKAFIQFARRLYKNNPYWVCPLDHEIKDLFDPKKNPFFEHGEAERWILTNFRGSMIGRIAAFVDRDKEPHEMMGGVGFFECIDHPKAASALFDQGKDWLLRKGAVSMQGPVNLLSHMGHVGLLTEGFEEAPLYGMPYHHAYYQAFFENYGFQLQSRHYNYTADLLQTGLYKNLQEKGKHLLADTAYRIVPLDKGNPDFAQHWMDIYNDAWQHHPHFSPLTLPTAREEVQKLLPVMDENMMLLAYHQEQPVGFFMVLPEMNAQYRYMNGKINLLGKLRYLMRSDKRKQVVALMIGVKKAHQGKGVASALISRVLAHLKSSEEACQQMEVAGITDTDMKALQMVSKLPLKMTRVFHTYQYHLQDEQQEAVAFHANQPSSVAKHP